MIADDLPPTGTCDVTTTGRRSGRPRRIEIWYVVVDGEIVITGTPGARDWLANVRAAANATLHLRNPARDVPVVAAEVVDATRRRRIVEQAQRIAPWYAAQPYSIDEWITGAPIVVLTAT